MFAGMVMLGAGAAGGLAPVMFVGLVAFGIGIGMNEIALNIEGAEVERILSRSVLAALHGFLSLGTVLGAVVGIALTALNVPVTVHLLAVATVCVPAISVARNIPPEYGRAESTGPHRRARHQSSPRRQAVKDRRIIFICLVALAMALAEGAATDWLPVLMVDGHGLSSRSDQWCMPHSQPPWPSAVSPVPPY